MTDNLFSSAINKNIQPSNILLVPIRLDIDHEGYQLHETFVWTSNNDLNCVDQFSEVLCVDYELPLHLYKPLITKNICDQVHDFINFASVKVPFEELKWLRIIIRLDIICGLIWLLDQFEWELYDERNSPEEFAAVYVAELGLSGEFKSAIAHAIREQSFLFTKALLTTGYRIGKDGDSEGECVIFNDLDLSLVCPTKASLGHRLLRTPDILDLFTPKILELTEEELEKLLYSRKRENRRKKRSVASVSSPPKTHRTFLGYRGSLHRINPSDYDEDNVGDRERRNFARNIPFSMGGFGSSTSSIMSVSSKRSGKRETSNFSIGRKLFCRSCNLETASVNEMASADICSKCGEPMIVVTSTNFSSNSSMKHLLTDKSTIHDASSTSMIYGDSNKVPGKRGRRPMNRPPIEYSVPIPQGPKADPEPLDAKYQAHVPPWLTAARTKLDEKYPLDLFTITHEEGELRMKCIECQKIYAVGPYQSLSNFETHLKNRTHRGIVDRRLSGESGGKMGGIYTQQNSDKIHRVV